MTGIDDQDVIYIIDDDDHSRDSLVWLLSSVNYPVKSFASADAFLAFVETQPMITGCIIADVRMPNTTGLDLQRQLNDRKLLTPLIFISGHASVDSVVMAIQAGAINFFSKPYNDERLLEAINAALDTQKRYVKKQQEITSLKRRFLGLSQRENQILQLILSGLSNKSISDSLHLSIKTVEFHRANLMKKTNSSSLVDLIKSYVIYQAHTTEFRL